MANRLMTVTVSPTKLGADGKTAATITYTAAAAADCAISAAAGFTVTPKTVALPTAAAGTKSVSLKVTGKAGSECQLTFSAFLTAKHARVKLP